MSAFVYWCISLCLGAGLLFVEYVLSKKKQWYWGIIPIFVVSAVLLGFFIDSDLHLQKTQNLMDVYAMKNGMKAEMRLKQDETHRVIAFSDLQITDRNGNLRDEASIRYQEESIICRYSKAAEYFKGKYSLDGDSSPISMMNESAVVYGDWSITPNSFLRIDFLLLIPLCFIYLCNRIFERKERLRKELKEIGLKFL